MPIPIIGYILFRKKLLIFVALPQMFYNTIIRWIENELMNAA